jgi:uncharacterized protein (UPF0335 family)
MSDFRNTLDNGLKQHYDNLKKIEELEEENKKLKEQIEKMKCCETCTFNFPGKGVGKCDSCKRMDLRNSLDNWAMVEP